MSIRKCRVYFCLYEQGDGSMEWPSLLGPDKIKLLKQLSSNCQPAEMAEDVQKLWKVASHTAYVMKYEYHIVHVLLHPVMIYTREQH